MASKKSAQAQIEESIQAPQILPAEEAPSDSWEIEEEVLVPRRPKGEEQFYWLCINGRSVQIPANGRVQTMKKPFAEALRNKIEADAAADDMADSIEVHDPITNPNK